VPFKVTRTWGVSQKESEEFESAVESSLGAEAIGHLKSSIKASSNHEMELTYSKSEEMSYECAAPSCGCCSLRVSQMVYDYEFICYTRGFWFNKDVWDREWSRTLREALPYYSGIPDEQEYDPRCKGCKEQRSPAYDGRLSLNFGNLSLFVPYKINDSGLVAQIEGHALGICDPNDIGKASYQVSLLSSFIHPALLFLGGLPEGELLTGRARIYRSQAMQLEPYVAIGSLLNYTTLKKNLDSAYPTP